MFQWLLLTVPLSWEEMAVGRANVPITWGFEGRFLGSRVWLQTTCLLEAATYQSRVFNNLLSGRSTTQPDPNSHIQAHAQVTMPITSIFNRHVLSIAHCERTVKFKLLHPLAAHWWTFNFLKKWEEVLYLDTRWKSKVWQEVQRMLCVCECVTLRSKISQAAPSWYSFNKFSVNRSTGDTIWKTFQLFSVPVRCFYNLIRSGGES